MNLKSSQSTWDGGRKKTEGESIKQCNTYNNKGITKFYGDKKRATNCSL